MDLAFDRQHIWHPYTSTLTPPDLLPDHQCRRRLLRIRRRNTDADGMSSWWSTIPATIIQNWNAAAHSQIDKVSHVMFEYGITRNTIDLCKKLLQSIASNLEHVFLADSGSSHRRNEALKWLCNTGAGTASFEVPHLQRYGYHGDTFAAMW